MHEVPFSKARRGGATLWLTIIISGAARVMEAQPYPDSLVILGAGRAGDWVTEYSIANSSSAARVVTLSSDTNDLTICTIPRYPFDCTTVIAQPEIPANGSLQLEHPVVGLNRSVSDVTAAYIRSPDLNNLTVRARMTNRATSQSVDLPVLRLSRFLLSAPTTLVFPGATRSARSRSNLVLATYAVSTCTDFTVRLKIEAYSGDGQLLGEREMTPTITGRFFLVDVLGFLGISSLEGGQLRVTSQNPCGAIWGILPSLLLDGGLSVSVGAHP